MNKEAICLQSDGSPEGSLPEHKSKMCWCSTKERNTRKLKNQSQPPTRGFTVSWSEHNLQNVHYVFLFKSDLFKWGPWTPISWETDQMARLGPLPDLLYQKLGMLPMDECGLEQSLQDILKSIQL